MLMLLQSLKQKTERSYIGTRANRHGPRQHFRHHSDGHGSHDHHARQQRHLRGDQPRGCQYVHIFAWVKAPLGCSIAHPHGSPSGIL